MLPSQKTLKIVAPILVIVIALVFLIPQVNAGILSCVGSALLNTAIQTGMNILQGYIGGFLSGFWGSHVPVNETLLRAKDTATDVIVRCVATYMYQTMNKAVVDIIRTSGRLGGPAFVRNWRNFQTDAQYRGENIFRAILSQTTLCPYMDQEIKNLFNANTTATALPSQNLRVGDLDPFRLRANCSMPSGFNLQAYNQNFSSNGGWDAFLRLSQPQNNLYGVIEMSLAEISKQRNLEQSGDVYETQGHGYTGRRGGSATNCLVLGLNGQCVVFRDILTPGSNLGESVNLANQSHFEYILNADEINELMVSGLGALTNRLLNLSSPNANEADYSEYSNVNTNDQNQPLPTFTVPPDVNPVTGYNCTIVPGSSQHSGKVSSALSIYLNDSKYSTVLNSSTGDQGAVDKFLQGVAGIIVQENNNILASRVVGPNGELSPDSIAVWKEGQEYIEYFDLLSGSGTISSSAQVMFVGLVSISCGTGGTLLPPIDEVQLCEENQYHGVCEFFPGDDSDINMSVNSVRVPPGTTVWLCNHSDFFCGCDQLNGEYSNPSYGGPSSSLTYSEPCEDTNCNDICDEDEPPCTFTDEGCEASSCEGDVLADGTCVEPSPPEEPPTEGRLDNRNNWYSFLSGRLAFLKF